MGNGRDLRKISSFSLPDSNGKSKEELVDLLGEVSIDPVMNTGQKREYDEDILEEIPSELFGEWIKSVSYSQRDLQMTMKMYEDFSESEKEAAALDLSKIESMIQPLKDMAMILDKYYYGNGTSPALIALGKVEAELSGIKEYLLKFLKED